MKHVIEILTDVCLLIFPIDMLYLYYSGSWYEPQLFILYSELVLCYCLPFFALWRIWQYFNGIKREGIWNSE